MLKEKTALGTIVITRSAVASLAAQAVLECYGVVGMAQPGLRERVMERFQRDTAPKGIVVRQLDRTIALDLYVVLARGVRISEVAQNIVEKVKFSVERATGFAVSEVEVHVQGLQDKQPGKHKVLQGEAE